MPPRPAVAASLSLLWPGLGQIYIGQRAKGCLCAVIAPLLCCGLGGLNVATAIDAWSLARKLQRGEAIGAWEQSPLSRALDAAMGDP